MYRLTNLYDLLVDATPFVKINKWVLICGVPISRMFLALFCLTIYAVAKESDSVQFKPRDYTPAKTLRSNTYEPKTYASKPQTPSTQFESKSVASKSAESKSAESKTIAPVKLLSDKTVEPSTPFTGKSADKQSRTEAKIYTQGEADFPSTISIDKSFSAQEKKSFLVSSNDSPFIITERPKEQNPLLEPRQGIKAPEETTPTKDPTK